MASLSQTHKYNNQNEDLGTRELIKLRITSLHRNSQANYGSPTDGWEGETGYDSVTIRLSFLFSSPNGASI